MGIGMPLVPKQQSRMCYRDMGDALDMPNGVQR